MLHVEELLQHELPLLLPVACHAAVRAASLDRRVSGRQSRAVSGAAEWLGGACHASSRVAVGRRGCVRHPVLWVIRVSSAGPVKGR